MPRPKLPSTARAVAMSVTVPYALWRKLTALSRKTKQPRSHIVAAALRDYLHMDGEHR